MTFALSPQARTLATAAKSAKFEPYAAPPPATYPCHGWSKTGSPSLVWVSMGQSYSGPATNYATLASSSSVTAGTAFSASGAFGSWSSSGSQTLTSGNTKDWTESLADRDFQSQFQYSRWLTQCQTFNRYAFTPDFGTGGDAQPAATEYPARNKCTTTSPGLWGREVSTGDAYSTSVGVKTNAVLGINLSVSHNYSTSSSTKFILTRRRLVTIFGGLGAAAAALGLFLLVSRVTGPTAQGPDDGPLVAPGGGWTMGLDPKAADRWTLGIPLCVGQPGTEPVLDTVTVTGGLGSYEFLGATLREFSPSNAHTPILSTFGYPPSVLDVLQPVSGYRVDAACGEGDSRYTELLLGIARRDDSGGGWIGEQVAYHVGEKQYAMALEYVMMVCGPSVPPPYCGPAPS